MRSTSKPQLELRVQGARDARLGPRCARWLRQLLRVAGARMRMQSGDNVVPVQRLQEARARREREAALLEDLECEAANDLGLRDGSDPTGISRS